MYNIIPCYRCKSFQSVKRGEICRIPGCSVSPSAPGTPTPVRLPQFQGETFKQFVNYVYTGKVRTDENFIISSSVDYNNNNILFIIVTHTLIFLLKKHQNFHIQLYEFHQLLIDIFRIQISTYRYILHVIKLILILLLFFNCEINVVF